MSLSIENQSGVRRDDVRLINANREHPRVINLKKNETGAGTMFFNVLKERYKNNPRRQINDFFEQFVIMSGTGRTRMVSIATRKTYRERMTTLVCKLEDMNMRIQNLDELSSKQVKLWVLHRIHCEFSFTPAEFSFTS